MFEFLTYFQFIPRRGIRYIFLYMVFHFIIIIINFSFGVTSQWCSGLIPDFAQGSLLMVLQDPTWCSGFNQGLLHARQSFTYYANSPAPANSYVEILIPRALE